jgi:hypothetical protein
MIIPTSDTVTPSQPKPKPAKRVMRTGIRWPALLDDFAASGLSKAAYCKQHGTATSSLNR